MHDAGGGEHATDVHEASNTGRMDAAWPFAAAASSNSCAHSSALHECSGDFHGVANDRHDAEPVSHALMSET